MFTKSILGVGSAYYWISLSRGINHCTPVHTPPAKCKSQRSTASITQPHPLLSKYRFNRSKQHQVNVNVIYTIPHNIKRWRPRFAYVILKRDQLMYNSDGLAIFSEQTTLSLFVSLTVNCLNLCTSAPNPGRHQFISLVLLTKICIAVDKENGLNPEIWMAYLTDKDFLQWKEQRRRDDAALSKWTRLL